MGGLDFVHRFVPGKAPDARVFLLLHGTGGDEADLLSLDRELEPDATLLSPRGKVSENGASRFFRRFAEGVFDEVDIVQRSNELADFIIVTAVGYSNGANSAAAMMVLRSEVLPAAILFQAMVVLANPPRADLRGKRVFVSAGRVDRIIPLENAQRLAIFLKDAGAEVKLEIQETGHGLVHADVAAAQGWLSP